ncbi:MAG: hypothetical protein WDM96_11890 [Lacunisphaera sp.]
MEMRFTGGPMPYRLSGDYALNDFDVGRLFKAFEPAKPPMVEGFSPSRPVSPAMARRRRGRSTACTASSN